MAMRDEEWWMRPENTQHFDLYMFWDQYHMGGHHDDDYNHHDDCEQKEIHATCFDFDMLEGDCSIHVSYNTCEDEWTCDVERTSDYDFMELIHEDCRGEFEGDVEFWNQMRQERFWTESVNE